MPDTERRLLPARPHSFPYPPPEPFLYVRERFREIRDSLTDIPEWFTDFRGPFTYVVEWLRYFRKSLADIREWFPYVPNRITDIRKRFRDVDPLSPELRISRTCYVGNF